MIQFKKQFKKTATDAILEKIKTGDVKMHSRSRFVLRLLLVVLAVVILTISAVYVLSFLFFVLRLNGFWFLPGFGLKGLIVFIRTFPWFLLLAVIAFVFTLFILVKKFSFIWRRPLIYSVAGLFLLVIFTGFLVDRTPLHQGFFRQAQENRLPLAGPLYRGYGMMKPHNSQAGTVTAINENGFKLISPAGQEFNVQITVQTHFPFDSDIEVGDNVFVMGEKTGETIKAFGVRKVESSDQFLMLHKLMRQHLHREL